MGGVSWIRLSKEVEALTGIRPTKADDPVVALLVVIANELKGIREALGEQPEPPRPLPQRRRQRHDSLDRPWQT